MLQSQQTLFFLFAILCSDSKIVSQSLQEDKKMAKISTDMLVGQIVNEYPELIDTLLEAGMHCLGCPSGVPGGCLHGARIKSGCSCFGIKQ